MTAFLMWLAGMFLSAFFSGSETGFYRVTRMRLALDALSGNWIARGLLWLTNNPALFVATTLIGNNLANYLTTLAIVLGVQQFFGGPQPTADVLAPIVLSPIVFVYGELLPKNLFYLAPNRLLRWGGPIFLFFTAIFAPVSGLLWVLARILQSMVGESPVLTRLRLARAELQRVLDEGHEIGILQPTQRQVAQAIFDVSAIPALRQGVSATKFSSVLPTSHRSDVLRTARRHRASLLLVVAESGHDVQGYVRVIDLHLRANDWQQCMRPILQLPHSTTVLEALVHMQTNQESLAEIVDKQGRSLSLVTVDRLETLLFEPSVRTRHK
ncbi:MAG: DUF21 domain-containing protein [Planctomycetales bacterium]|nr:DUF21 domain-containing protein [Planctomycetales bacterium]